MKQFLHKLFLSIVLCNIGIFSFADNTETVTVDGFKVLIDKDNNTATLQANDYTGDIVVPEKITWNGSDYPITAFGDQCFLRTANSKSFITSIIIPNTVKSFGYECFRDCQIESIKIPNSVTALGFNCFRGCYKLKSIEIPNSVKNLGNYCFVYCSNLKTAKLNNNNLSFGMFQGCSSLENVNIPQVTRIENSTFEGCSSLKNISLPEGIIQICANAFFGCKSLESITLPTTLKTLGDMNSTGNIGCFQNCTNLKEIIIPSNVSGIAYASFKGCTQLERITLGSSLKNIKGEAFKDCPNLKEINVFATVPPTLTNVGVFATNNYESCNLNVLSSSADAYKDDEIWGQFQNIQALTTTEPGTEELQANINDNEPNIAAGTYKPGNITYIREGQYIKTGKYVAQCMPFDINLSETPCFSEVFIPINIALYNTDSKLLTLMLDKVDMNTVIKAGQPFVAKLASDKVELKNCNSTYISSNYTEENIETTLKVYNSTSNSGVLEQNSDLDVRFGGTYLYKSGLDKKANYTFMSSGGFAESDHVLPFRAYIYKANLTTQISVESISWGIGDETTGIKEIPIISNTSKDNRIFTLDGKLVNQTGNPNNLPKGIYIINGRKISIQ